MSASRTIPITLTVNGTQSITQAVTVADLLAEQGRQPDTPGIAVAVNDEVIPRAAWSTTDLIEGSRVEIITAMAGG